MVASKRARVGGGGGEHMHDRDQNHCAKQITWINLGLKHFNLFSMPAGARTRARRPRAVRARTATPRCRRERQRRGHVPPGTSRECARRIASVR